MTGVDPGRIDMLVLLRRLADELAASTDARSWSAKVGLTSGAVVDVGQIGLDQLPTVILEERRGRTVTWTTLRDVVHIELGRGGMPRLERSLVAGRQELSELVVEELD